jgi:hypothetical protein
MHYEATSTRSNTTDPFCFGGLSVALLVPGGFHGAAWERMLHLVGPDTHATNACGPASEASCCVEVLMLSMLSMLSMPTYICMRVDIRNHHCLQLHAHGHRQLRPTSWCQVCSYFRATPNQPSSCAVPPEGVNSTNSLADGTTQESPLEVLCCCCCCRKGHESLSPVGSRAWTGPSTR